jgi:adenylate cyclase
MTEGSILKGKVVFIALTAEGLANQVATPVGIRYGHDLVINALDTMISGRNLDRPFWADSAEIAITIAGSILIMILVLYCPWVVGIAAITGILGGVYFGSEYAFTDKNLILDWSFPIASIFIIWSASAFIRFISEFRQKMQIKKQFGTYLSPAMVEKLQKNPELLRLGGETRELSIMFTDVRGFTTISEHYGEDVQGLTKIMNRYMTAMTTRILANEGTIDKYIGDAQMALWNAPLDDANHRQNALRTALAMLDDLEKFNAEISSERIPAFGMGIGINSGPVVVGNMGSIQRFDYTCLGDNVNLAARLEGQSKEYGVKIVLGENTITGLDEDFVILELDTIAVKGKSIGVRIFTCLGHSEEINSIKTKNDQLLHRNMLENYRQKKFKSCMRRLDSLYGSFGGKMDDYYDMMNARCAEFEANPPEENWDGVYRAKTK